MQQRFQTSAELQHAVTLFESCLEALDVNYSDFLSGSLLEGKEITSLNDIVGIAGMPLGEHKGLSAILFYFTELDIPIIIKDEIEVIFNELFYSA